MTEPFRAHSYVSQKTTTSIPNGCPDCGRKMNMVKTLQSPLRDTPSNPLRYVCRA